MARHRFIFIMLMLAAVAGCQRQGPRTTPWYKIRQPEVEIVAVNLTEQTEQGARIEVTARLTNPNEVALPLKRYHLTFDADHRPAVTFRDLSNRTLPAQGEQLVVMPLALATGAGNLTDGAYRVSGWIHYEPPGEIRRLLTESGIPLPSAAFRKEGALAASR